MAISSITTEPSVARKKATSDWPVRVEPALINNITPILRVYITIRETNESINEKTEAKSRVEDNRKVIGNLKIWIKEKDTLITITREIEVMKTIPCRL
jgi:hypothetical protein